MPPNNVEPELIEKLKLVNAKGVIFQLPADKTYLVDTPEVQSYVKNLVENFRNTSIHVVLDLTPNFVTTEDELYRLALNDTKYRDAFVWAERAVAPTTWLAKDGGGSAWKEVKAQNWVLSQFGVNNIDLQLNNPIAKEKFKNVLQSLIKLGVKGFRLANSKHFIIKADDLKDEVADPEAKGKVHADYDFWTHQQTTLQNGLGGLLKEFSDVVKNYTSGTGFLSVTESIERPEVFTVSAGHFGFDLPIYTALPHTLTNTGPEVAKQLVTELTLAVNNLGPKTWAQWVYNSALDRQTIGLSEYNIFLFLLPGVPVAPIENLIGNNGTDLRDVHALEEIRATASYQHGSFDVYTDANQTVVAYTRCVLVLNILSTSFYLYMLL